MSRADQSGIDIRNKILETASDLFYRHGVRAVGVDLVVEKAGVAKTSLYRHFRTKDDLIAAFLEREDQAFWAIWNRVAESCNGDARAELTAELDWIGTRVGQPGYRGCAQLNVTAEFPEADHPARQVAIAHKRKLREQLKGIVERLHVGDPDLIAGQIAMLVDGALVSSNAFDSGEPLRLLQRAVDVLISASIPTPAR
ncbi:TetR/AcrR family transcriptional regulator [Paraburkholderia sp. GAS199]|uniref:TetR/AcrR family transcriptional regulator n=1 Tax=Paraburkholderia sp. GAS199 TaxID=3035126 RepID=UPI003D21C2DB